MLYWLIGFLTIFIIEEMVRGSLTASDKKSYWIKNSSLLILVFIILFLFGPLIVFSPIKLGLDELQEQGLRLYYPAGKIDIGKDIFQMAKQAQEKNEAFYRFPTSNSVLVALSDFDMVRFGGLPGAGGTGSALGVNVLLKKASWNIIAHEMSHRNLADIATLKMVFSMPRWFDEGLASYLGKMDYYKKPEDLKNDLEQGRYNDDFLQWKGVIGNLLWAKGTLRDQQGRQLYGQSYLMVKYLFDKYGEDKMYDFVVSLKSQDFEKAFLQSFGMTEKQFHQEFINYIQNSPSISVSSLKQVVENYMRATLGTIPQASINYEKAKEYVAEDLKTKLDDPSFIPLSYGIQDGPSDIKFESEKINGNTAVVVVSGIHGNTPQIKWQFDLTLDKGVWKIAKIKTANQ